MVVNHLLQVVGSDRDGSARRRDAETIKTRKFAVFRSIDDADPKRYVRGQYEGYLGWDGVQPSSQTETFAALRLEIDNWRWAGVPFFIRTGKRLPVKQTEVRLVFKHPPKLAFIPCTAAGRSQARS